MQCFLQRTMAIPQQEVYCCMLCYHWAVIKSWLAHGCCSWCGVIWQGPCKNTKINHMYSLIWDHAYRHASSPWTILCSYYICKCCYPGNGPMYDFHNVQSLHRRMLLLVGGHVLITNKAVLFVMDSSWWWALCRKQMLVLGHGHILVIDKCWQWTFHNNGPCLIHARTPSVPTPACPCH